MKNLRTAAVIAVLAMNLLTIVVSFEYYKAIGESLFASGVYSGSFTNQVQNIFYVLGRLFEITLTLVFLFAATVEVKDKAYRLLRFVFVIYFLFYLPFNIYYVSTFLDATMGWRTFYYFGMELLSMACVVAFLIAKPERPVARIDLSDYELVSYTSTGHRLLHYFLDVLFLLPILLTYTDSYLLGSRNSLIGNLTVYLAYFLYFFVAEAIFRQTLGKIVTNSCVVSSGINLSIGRVLIRTLCRYIPFDGLSFLFKANWHDRASSTAVVYVNTWEKVFDDPNQGENAEVSSA